MTPLDAILLLTLELRAIHAAPTPHPHPRKLNAAMGDLDRARREVRNAAGRLDSKATRSQHWTALELMDRIDNLMTNLSEWGE